jgi:molecular chaperone GrpE
MSRAEYEPDPAEVDLDQPEGAGPDDGDRPSAGATDPAGQAEAGDDGGTATAGATGGTDGEDFDAADVEAAEAEETVEADLAALVAQRDEYLDTLRRVQADFENYKKRVLRQQTEHLERAAEGLVTKLLAVLDTVDLALAHAGEEADAALSQVAGSLWDVLGKEGLEKLEPLGGAFDPNEAEAVMHEPADEGQSAPEVVEVLRPGYRWRGRVIRPAMVKVRG